MLQNRYFHELDVLRAISVIFVLMEHWGISRGLPLGMIGVQTFFVLSGFLITNILLNQKENDNSFSSNLKTFYIRRSLRIFPIFYITIVILYLLNAFNVRDEIIYHLTYTSNIPLFLNLEWSNKPVHFWSLAVEEQFYLIWPTLILLTPKVRITTCFYSLLVFSLSFEVFYLFQAYPYNLTYQILLPSNISSFCLGALIIPLLKLEKIYFKNKFIIYLFSAFYVLLIIILSTTVHQTPLVSFSERLMTKIFIVVLISFLISHQKKHHFF